jgi:hypothetical protein
VLTLHALCSLTLAFFTEIHDWKREILGVDLDLVVRVLDDLDCHGVHCVDSLNIHGYGVLCHNSGHFKRWSAWTC